MPRPLVFLILALPLVGAYALYATGIVAIYQASRVLNLAHGALATVPAFLTYTMVRSWGIPLPIGMVLGVASGALFGVAIERVFVRRLRRISATAQTVGTVAAFGVMVSLTAKIWGTTGLTAPTVFPEGEINVGASILRYGQIGLFVVAVVVTAVLHVFLQRTWFGLAMRGAAVNRRAASLMGVDPDRTTTAAWALGGALAAGAGILLAAVTVLQPYTLALSVLPAFVAALIGGLGSLPGALAGSAIVGVVIGFVPLLADLPVLGVVLGQVGGPELALAATAMVVMALRGQRLVATDVRAEFARAPVARPRSASARGRGWLWVIGLPLLVGWVFLPRVPFTLLGDVNLALVFGLVALSLVLLTGWVGQISLAQAAFVGVGAFGTALIVRVLHVPFPFNLPLAAGIAALAAALLGIVALRVRGLYLAVATLIFGWMADNYLFAAPWLVGAGGSATVRTDPIGTRGGFPFFDITERRTFYLVALAEVAIVILALVNLRRSKTGRALFAIRGSETAAASLGIDVTRYKLMAFAVAGFIAGMAGNLVAVNQETIVPAQFAFTWSLFYLSVAVVGGLNSIGGAMGSALLFAGLNELFFQVPALEGWLDVVSASLLAAVLLFYPGGLAAAPEALRRLRALASSVTARLATLGGLGTTETARPPRRLADLRARMFERLRVAKEQLRALGREVGGAWQATLVRAEGRVPRYAHVFRTMRREVTGLRGEGRALARAAAAVGARVGEINQASLGLGDRFARLTGGIGRSERDPEEIPDALGRLVASADQRAPSRGSATPVLEAHDISVRFGGLLAVSRVSLEVLEGGITGLIGPNGAGKTTLFNAIAGLVEPSTGRVSLRGEDITHLAVHERAARGIGRTFQVIQLAPDLTVHENLMIATHVRDPSSFASHLVMTARSVTAEADAVERVQRVADLMELEDVLDRPAGDLSLGTLRIVELARALVTGAPVIMLDEPASGLDAHETEAFGRLLVDLRDRLGVSLLLIEHDVQLVMSICDRVYVLDRGERIAAGTPQQVQAEPQVRAAYLGGEAEDPAPSTASV